MILLFSLLLPLAHAADVITEAQKTQEKITKVDDQSHDLLGELYLIQKRVKDVSKSREKLNSLMLSSDGDAQTLAQTLAILEKRLTAQKNQLSRRLILLYRWNSPSLLPFVFSSASAVEFERNFRYVRLFSERDFQYLKTYEHTLQATRSERSKLKSKVRILISLKKQIEAEEGKIADLFQRKTKLLQQMRDQKEAGLKTLASLRTRHPELESELRTGFFEKRGVLPPPVDGIVESKYGTLVDPTYFFRLLKKGWQYRTSSTGVRSVFSGEVAFAGKLPGYGRTAIVDHGDHYYTVYGWLGSLNVENGERIQQGDMIGQAGQHMYFEIRHFSDAIDPATWINEAGGSR